MANSSPILISTGVYLRLFCNILLLTASAAAFAEALTCSNYDSTHSLATCNRTIYPDSNLLPQSFTAECWFRPILYAYPSTPILSCDAFRLSMIYQKGAYGAGLGIQLTIFNSSGQNFSLQKFGNSLGNLDYQKWSHIVGAYNAESNTLVISIDGNVSTGTPVPFSAFHVTTNNTFSIGPFTSNSYGKNDYCVDDIRISDLVRYRVSFTPSQRLKADEHTRALYNFDEDPSEKIFHDSSVNGFHLTKGLAGDLAYSRTSGDPNSIRLNLVAPDVINLVFHGRSRPPTNYYAIEWSRNLTSGEWNDLTNFPGVNRRITNAVTVNKAMPRFFRLKTVF